MLTLFHTQFTIYDLATLMIVILSTVMSIRKGFARSALTFLAWIATILITFWLFPYISPLLKKIFSNTTLVVSSTLGITFLFFLIALSSIASAWGKNIQQGSFRKYDNMLGVAFGILRGFLIASLIIVLSNVFTHQQSKYIKNSFVYPAMNGLATTIQTLTPSIKDDLTSNVQQQYQNQVSRPENPALLHNKMTKRLQ